MAPTCNTGIGDKPISDEALAARNDIVRQFIIKIMLPFLLFIFLLIYLLINRVTLNPYIFWGGFVTLGGATVSCLFWFAKGTTQSWETVVESEEEPGIQRLSQQFYDDNKVDSLDNPQQYKTGRLIS